MQENDCAKLLETQIKLGKLYNMVANTFPYEKQLSVEFFEIFPPPVVFYTQTAFQSEENRSFFI